MPMYEYACSDCGMKSEYLMKATDSTPACRACGSTNQEKQIASSTGFNLKGPGWHSGGLNTAPRKST